MKKEKQEEIVRNRDISLIAKDIITMKIKGSDSFDSVMKKFYKIMMKHNIAMGTKDKCGAILCNNYEWTMCKDLFMGKVKSYFEITDLFGSQKIPKKLRHY